MRWQVWIVLMKGCKTGLCLVGATIAPAACRPEQTLSPCHLDVQARRSFSEVLASSLKVENRMRAWYDAALGYQPVQQTRLPKTLPKVGHLRPLQRLQFLVLSPSHSEILAVTLHNWGLRQ